MSDNSYSTSRNKLQKLHNKNKITEKVILVNKNDDKKLFKTLQKIKSEKIIYDSDWMPISVPALERTVIKGEIGACEVQVQLIKDFDIPDNLLPFVNWQLLLKTNPEVEVENYYQHTTHPIGNNWIQIRGDSTIIYDGLDTGILNTTVYTQDDIDAGTINSSFTKKVFNIELQYMEAGDLYRIVGHLIRTDLRVNQGTGCDNLDFTIYRCTPNTNGHPTNKFLDVNSSFINAVWEKEIVEFIGSPGSCSIGTDNTTDGITESVSLSAVNSSNWTVENGKLDKWNGSDWITLSTGAINKLALSNTDLVSFTGEFIGYWAYFYSNDWQRVNTFFFQANNILGSSCRGTQFTSFISNTPSPVDVPYSNLYIEINPSGKPTTDAIINAKTIFHTLHFTEPTFLKLTDNKYRIFYNKTLFLSAPCTILQSNQTDRFVITYNSNITNYLIDGVECNNTLETEYVPNVGDVQIKLIGSIVNPFYWSEQKRVQNGN